MKFSFINGATVVHSEVNWHGHAEIGTVMVFYGKRYRVFDIKIKNNEIFIYTIHTDK